LPAFALVKVLAPAFYARQDTKTPVKAGIAAMIANMALNLLFVGALYLLWRGNATDANLLEGIASIPGLHMGIALASALASYLNLWLLWKNLSRAGVYEKQPGWMTHAFRLAASCAALIVVLAIGVFIWPDWSQWPTTTRVLRLAILIAAGAAAYLGVLFGTGFRLRDLRAH
jgi:putative peptidoglycan lipid II flippase